jgi:hypothetical protein
MSDMTPHLRLSESQNPQELGKDAFSSESESKEESGEQVHSSENSAVGPSGTSESRGTLSLRLEESQLAEGLELFPEADRRTAATRRAIDKQTTIFAVLFKEFGIDRSRKNPSGRTEWLS